MWLCRTCAAAECRTLAEHASEFCAVHVNYRAEKEKVRRESQPWLRWYGWAVWKTLRRMQLSREPMCQHQGCDAIATEVDHIVPHKGNWDLFRTLDNLQSLCHLHHSEKTAAENVGFGSRDNVVRR